MKPRIVLIAVLSLACINIFTLIQSTQALKQNETLENVIKDNPPRIVYVQAKDGKTPIVGVDFPYPKDGINSVSFSRTTEVIKEVPLIGEKGTTGDSPACLQEQSQCRGENGVDAPVQEIRINSSTGDLENKLSSTRLWNTLLTCSDFRTVCP